MRSIFFIVAAAALIWLLVKNKIKPVYVLAGLLLLTVVDLLPVGKRYLNDNSFVEPEEFEATFTPTDTERLILADANKPFRVFDQTEDPFNNTQSAARASYYYNSIGGYHPAKLALYQDIIERQLSKGNMQVFNMLNTRYFIVRNPATGQPQPQLNSGAFGPAWFVKGIRYVASADEEMNALDNTSLRDTVIVQEKFKSKINSVPGGDTAATIKVTEYLNDKITYTYSSSTPQFAVFSEVYYPLGWEAYVDGKRTEYVKVNYVLRGMALPAGNHKVEFRFDPTSFKLGNNITLVSSILTVLLLAAAIFNEIRRKKKTNPKIENGQRDQKL